MPVLPPAPAVTIQAAGPRHSLARVLRLFLSVLLLGTGGILTALSAQGYVGARSLVDHLSKDGSMERFTPALYSTLRWPLLALGLVMLLAGAGGLVFPRRGQAVVEGLLAGAARLIRRLAADARLFWRDVRSLPLTHADGLAVGLLTLGGVLLRGLYLSRPMVHDEAYTFMAFASRPWLAVISDYHLPNNHIFHTILVKLATSLLGDAPWAVRFPAFLAGVLCIPAGYVLAKRLYGRWTAVLAGGLVAALPVLVMYSTNARGYSLYTLFSLLLFLLAIYLTSQRNLAGWLVFILIAVLGFYTLPIMLYPFGGVMAWLLLSGLAGDGSAVYGARWGMVKYLLAAGLLVGVFSALLYLPVILIGTGWDSLVGNTFVGSLSLNDFWQTIVIRMAETRGEWMTKLPAWLGLLAALGVLLSIFLHRRISRVKFPMQQVMLGWLAAVLLIQRPNPLARLWTFLIPLVAIWAAAGLVEPLVRVRFPVRRAISAGAILALVGLAYLGVSAVMRAHLDYPAWQEAPGEVEQIVQYIQPRLQEGDMIIISSSDAPPLWYYSRLYGIDPITYDHLESSDQPFRRAFVVVSLREGQTLQTAIEQRSLSPARFDLAAAERVLALDNFQVYICPLR